MATPRHARPPELEGLSLEDIMQTHVGRFSEKRADWAAFEDAKTEGYRRAQHRFIGAGGSGKHDDPDVIPARGFTLSIMLVPPGQGNAPHTHEVEECCFVLQGFLDVFVEDDDGRRLSRAGPVGMHLLPAGRDPRLSERKSGTGLFPGHARPRQARNHGLCGRRALQQTRCASEAIGARATPAPQVNVKVIMPFGL
jgi:mannose-6-phosphate isomerase-like protein (cupin superfamily)